MFFESLIGISPVFVSLLVFRLSKMFLTTKIRLKIENYSELKIIGYVIFSPNVMFFGCFASNFVWRLGQVYWQVSS